MVDLDISIGYRHAKRCLIQEHVFLYISHTKQKASHERRLAENIFGYYLVKYSYLILSKNLR